MTKLLEAEKLGVHLQGKQILEDVSFFLEPRELVSLIGPNGAGKTTLMRVLMGLIKPSSGTLRREPGVVVGYVPQSKQIEWSYPISVESFVALSFLGKGKTAKRKRDCTRSRRNSTLRWEQVYRALAQVDAFELRKRSIQELSGGQKQRVLLARALTRQPELLLLDEPFTGLDYPNQDLLTALIETLRKKGVSILMSTHDLVQAVEISDRLLMLNRTVVAQGTSSLFKEPELWMKTYGVSKDSALLNLLGMRQ